MKKGECGKEADLQSTGKRHGVEAEAGGRDSILDMFQKSCGRALPMDQMWDVKERSKGWLQVLA